MKTRGPLTVSGKIDFKREVWQCASRECRVSHAPVDLAIGLRPKGQWTPGVERKSAYVAALSPYVEASAVLEELADLKISSSEIDRVGQEHGEVLDAIQREEEEAWRAPVDPLRPTPEPELSPERLVIEADATSVLTVGGEEHKSVYCGTAFSLDARGKSGNRPFLTDRLYAGSAQNMEDFSERLKALAWRSGMRRAKQVAFVGDGARCLWKWAEENLPEGSIFIQDFWHVCEHLSKLAQLLFPEKKAEKTFKLWKGWLRKSKLKKLFETLRALHTQRRGKSREALGKEIAYLENAQHRMDYARYEKEGWLIGSGAIEGTCKHLVKTRFGVTGARWRRRNIYKPLALRLAIFNNEWEEYWENREIA